jgi:regulator of replication initiation timing
MATIEGIAAAVITRPPEIVLCLKMSVSGQTVFIVFDSHPRPSHPMGSGFTLNSTVEDTASCLDDLLSIDSGILSDPSLVWQAQTLGYFSAHVLVPVTTIDHSSKIDDMLMDASTKMLQLMVEVSELKSEQVNLIERNDYLTDRLKQLERSRLQSGVKGKGRAVETDSSDCCSRAGDSDNISGIVNLGDSSSRELDSSEEMARKLQAKFDEENRKIVAEGQKLQKQNKTFDCGVCFETLPYDFVARIKGCKHTFCRDCLRQHATTTIENRRYPIPCPGCLADNSEKPRSKSIHSRCLLIPNDRQMSRMVFCKRWVSQMQHIRYSKSCSSLLIP